PRGRAERRPRERDRDAPGRRRVPAGPGDLRVRVPRPGRRGGDHHRGAGPVRGRRRRRGGPRGPRARGRPDVRGGGRGPHAGPGGPVTEGARGLRPGALTRWGTTRTSTTITTSSTSVWVTTTSGTSP